MPPSKAACSMGARVPRADLCALACWQQPGLCWHMLESARKGFFSNLLFAEMLFADMMNRARRLPGSNLLFGLPVVLDTHDPTIKEGSKVCMVNEALLALAVYACSQGTHKPSCHGGQQTVCLATAVLCMP
eukprot:867223-Pelagomonas_calceolata.AAC.12